MPMWDIWIYDTHLNGGKRILIKIFIHHTMVALYTAEKKMLKNLSKQCDYDNSEWQSNPKDSD